ncbi:MAG: DUF2336 domain-containing protein [Alphaproteobacteria bacterium]
MSDEVKTRDRRPMDRADYEARRDKARSDDPDIRRALAADPETPPEILYYLSEDPDPDVRKAVASNRTTPRQADLILTQDTDVAIRSELGQKIARLTPDLPADRRSTLYKLTVQALEALAEDQMVRVREILAHELRHVSNAPRNVIVTLAKDRELSVAGTVMEFSPVLSDKDLLDIINSGPIQGAMNAIAKREALKASVSDAIARTGDEEAVATLLSNESAQIREDTLDYIIDHAPDKKSWHEPLVMRPKLKPRTVQRIASFVAMNLLDKLQARLDLDDEALVAVASAVETRLADDAKKQAQNDAISTDGGLEARIDRMYLAGELTGTALEKALAQGDKAFAILALSKLSGISAGTVQQIVTGRSAKAAVALTWKSGLTPRLAAQIQSQLLGLAPKEAIPIFDGWPMTEDAMNWQLEFHANSTSII